MSASKFCKACGKPIEWHPSATSGAAIPIDPDPHENGRLAFDGRMRLGTAAPNARRRYRCHYDTCPRGLKPERPAVCDRDGCERTDRHLHCFQCGETDHLANECEGA